jgi:hypothetical protein
MKAYKVGEYRDKMVLSSIDFNWTPLHLTYNNGQQVDSYDAGASLVVKTELASEIAKVPVGEFLNCTDDNFYEVQNNCEYRIDFDIESEEVLCHNYWNGNNWKTLVLDCGNVQGYPDLEIMDNAETEKILNGFETKEFVSESFGAKRYESENYIFIESQFASAWEDFEVIEK